MSAKSINKIDKTTRKTAIAAVMAAVWAASLAITFYARAKCERLVELSETNLNFAEELAPERAALSEYRTFLEPLILSERRQPSIAAALTTTTAQDAAPKLLDESVVSAQWHGLRKSSASVKWTAISGETLGRVIESADALSPPFRLEAISLTKPAANNANAAAADTLAVEAVFIAYSR